ncbi:MAG TPA: amidophosphoribosyltransferase [Actinomycetes bacterium]|jgi:amidophosphoribosyltransferase|nr:amidophosphoribosyltransferase [Actinomycetes bacterium]
MLDADHPREACGVFGVWAPGEQVANLVFYGLYALQHRGQESAGMAVADGRGVLVYKEMGLVSQVFDEPTLATLQGHLAIGHTRYSTTGGSRWENAQPAFKTNAAGGGIALAHNGNLTNTAVLAASLAAGGPEADGLGGAARPSSDTDVMAELLAHEADLSLEEAIVRTMPRLEGAFSLVIMDERTLYGVRDRHGVRPLCIGKLPGGWVIASETAALDIVGATLVREVEPGEVVAIDEQGLRARRFAPPEPRLCVFEHVYLARADSTLAGQSVHQVRRALGAALAVEAPVDADLVIPVPDTAWSAAAGYAEASGIPFGEGLMKNRYVGRTFIQPSQTMRQLGIRIKLNPLREAIRGLRLVVVDDSIVRGNTTKAIVAMLREAGAREVHVRITSPPVRWPCFYGIDMPTRAELVASDLLTDEVASYVGADSLGYLSLEALTDTAASPTDGPGGLCTACFTGNYPIPVEAQVQGKELLEGLAPPR